MSNLNAQLQIRVTPEQRAKGHEVAAQRQETLSEMVRRMLSDAIAEAEAKAKAEQEGQAVGQQWTQRQRGRAA